MNGEIKYVHAAVRTTLQFNIYTRTHGLLSYDDF